MNETLYLLGKFQIGRFATGNYGNFCAVCGKYFTGDKWAVQCLECAITAKDKVTDGKEKD